MNTRFSNAVNPSPSTGYPHAAHIKRVLIWLYCHRLLSLRMTQRAIDALKLQGA